MPKNAVLLWRSFLAHGQWRTNPFERILEVGSKPQWIAIGWMFFLLYKDLRNSLDFESL